MAQKIAIVTGGNRGLGKNTVEHLLARGIDVIFTYNSHRDEADALGKHAARAGRRAVALQLDVTDSSRFTDFTRQVTQMLQQHWQRDRFDFLVNNAGIGINAPFIDTTEAQLDQLYAIHLKAPYLLTQRLLPLITDGGRIVNISSGLARFALPGFSAYAAMKGAIEVLTRYQAKELGIRGIAVNTVAPGAIETDFGGGAVRDNAQANQYIASQTALGRVGLPDDIGGVIASLLADDCRWINAQRIEASGGMFI